MAWFTIVSDHLKEIARKEGATEEKIIQSWLELWEDGIDDDILILDTTFLEEDEDYSGYRISVGDRPRIIRDGYIFSLMDMMNVQLENILNSGKTIMALLSESRILIDKPNATIYWDNYHWLPFIEGFHTSDVPPESYNPPIRKFEEPAKVKIDSEANGLEKYFLNAGWSNIEIQVDETDIEEYEIIAYYHVDAEYAVDGNKLPAGIVVNSWRDSDGDLIEPEGNLVLLPKPFELKINVKDWFASLVEVGAAYSTENVGHDQFRRIIGRSDSESLQRIYRICERLPEVHRQLQNRYDNRETISVGDEYDLQDLFHGLLKLYYNDTRAEEWAPSYGGTSPRIDFLIKQETIAIELKITRPGRANQDIKKELVVDKEHYRTHPDCQTLVCYVYDPEYQMDNPVGFEEDLSESSEDLTTEVIVSSSNRFE